MRFACYFFSLIVGRDFRLLPPRWRLDLRIDWFFASRGLQIEATICFCDPKVASRDSFLGKYYIAQSC